jgi:ABC-type molybdenum transport system ATPase subunit/photorepair protein PhrA
MSSSEYVPRRDLIGKLYSWLDSQERSRIAVYGKGGCGKSTLAKMLVAEVQTSDAYDFKVVAWLRGNMLQQDYMALAAQLSQDCRFRINHRHNANQH